MDAGQEKADAGLSALPSTLRALADEYHSHAKVVRGVLDVTADAERPYLRRFLDWFGPPGTPAALFAAIGAGSVTGCLVAYAAAHGPGSRRGMQKTVRLFLRFAWMAGYLPCDLSALSPSVRTPRMGKLARAIPPESIERVVSSVGCLEPVDLRDRAMLCLLSTYGVRGVQVRRLQLEDLDWDGERIRFPAVKGGRPVEQPLVAKVGNCLADYMTRGRPASPCREVFLTDRPPFGAIAHPRQLSRIVRRRLERAGVELPQGVAYGSHGFRHAFASRLYGRVPFKEIVDLLGHRDPSTTLVYGKVDLAALSEAMVPWPEEET